MIYNNAGISGLTGPDSHESPDILQRLDMYRGYPSEKLGPIASNGDLAAVSVLADRKDQERRQKENAAKNPTTTAIEDLLAKNNMPVGSNSLPQMPQAKPGMQGADTAMPKMGSPPGAGMIGAPSSPGMGLASQGPPTGSQMPPAGFNPQGGQGQPPVMGAKDGGLVDTFRRSGVRGFSEAGEVPRPWYPRTNPDGSNVPTHMLTIDELIALRDSKLSSIGSDRGLTPQNRTRILPRVSTLAETIRRNSQAVPGGNLYGPRDPFQPGGAHYPERQHPVPSEQYKNRMTVEEVRAVDEYRESGPSDFSLGMGNDEELTALIKDMAGISRMSDEELVEQTDSNKGPELRELPAEYAEADLTMADYEADQAWLAANNNGVDESKNINGRTKPTTRKESILNGIESLDIWVQNIAGKGREAIKNFVDVPTENIDKEFVKDFIENDMTTAQENQDFVVGSAKDVYGWGEKAVDAFQEWLPDGIENSGINMEGGQPDYDLIAKMYGGDGETSVASTTAPVVVQSGDQSGDPVAAYPPVKNPITWSPDGGWLGAKTTGDRPPLADAGRLDVTAMDKFMDKIEEMQRGKRGMALLAMSAEMGKRHKGGFLPAAVAGMNAAGQSARGTDRLAMEGYGLAAGLEQRDYASELSYQGRLAQARRSASDKASDNEDRMNARKQATFDAQWVALLKNDNAHMLESIMKPIYESEFGNTEAAAQALKSLKARFYGGSLGGDQGEITVSDQLEARGVVMRALAEQIRSQQMFAGDSGGGDQRNVPLNAFLQRGDA